MVELEIMHLRRCFFQNPTKFERIFKFVFPASFSADFNSENLRFFGKKCVLNYEVFVFKIAPVLNKLNAKIRGQKNVFLKIRQNLDEFSYLCFLQVFQPISIRNIPFFCENSALNFRVFN